MSSRRNNTAAAAGGGGGGERRRLKCDGGMTVQRDDVRQLASLSMLTKQHSQLVHSMSRLLHADGIDLATHPFTNRVRTPSLNFARYLGLD